jgi:DsbC/DsbD-like thiol-disulfide interchange protein
MFRQVLLGAFSALFLAGADAATAEITDPVRGEILHGWQRPDGTRVAAIKLELDPGWKTYWRSPGDSGIPLQISWAGSRNLRAVGLNWPVPKVYREDGITTIGYKDRLVLPVTLAPKKAGAPLLLRAELDMGVCKDVCIPYRMTLTAEITDTETRPSAAIAAALADRPMTAREGRVVSARCRLTPGSDGLNITTDIEMPPLSGQEIVVLEPGSADIWTSEMDVQRRGSTLSASGEMASVSGRALALDRSQITITVLGGGQAVEIKGCSPA